MQITIISIVLLLLSDCTAQSTVDINEKKYNYAEPWNMEKQYGTYYVDRLECATKECGKALFFYKRTRELPKVYIIDFDSKEYNYYILYRQKMYRGRREMKRYLKTSSETYSVFTSTKNPNQYNFEDQKDVNSKENIYYYVEPFAKKSFSGTFTTSSFVNRFFIGKYINTMSFNTEGLEKKGFTKNLNIKIRSKKSYLQDKQYLQDFINRHNLNDIIHQYKRISWYPDTGNTHKNITGKGSISFGGSQKYRISIQGTFSNGLLVSKGNIFIRKWYSDGGIHFFSQSVTKKEIINSSTNIKQTILDMYRSLDIDIAKFIASKKRASSQTYSSPSYKSCNSYDTCHQVIEVINPRKVKIKCIRGSNTGRTRTICANSNGKWATGCGFTDVLAHHHRSISEAAKNYCD